MYQDIDFLATGRQWGKIKIFVTYNGQSKSGKKLVVVSTMKEIVF